MTMSNKKASVIDQIPTVEPVAVQPVMIYCRDCKHWRKPWPKANIGECGLSRSFLASPIHTPSLASCDDATT